MDGSRPRLTGIPEVGRSVSLEMKDARTYLNERREARKVKVFKSKVTCGTVECLAKHHLDFMVVMVEQGCGSSGRRMRD